MTHTHARTARPIVQGEALLRAIVREDAHALADLLAPVAPWRGDVTSGLALLEGGESYHARLLGMQVLATKFRSDGDYVTAADLARALFRALEYDPATMDAGQPALRRMAANVCDTLSALLTELGGAAEVYLEANRWIRFLERAGLEADRIVQVGLKQLEALLQGGHYEDAAQIAEHLRAAALPAHLTFEFDRLDRKVNELCRPVSAPAKQAIDPQQLADGAIEALASIVGGVVDPAAIREAVVRAGPGSVSFDPNAIFAALSAGGRQGWTAAPSRIDELEQRVRALPEARQPYAAFAAVVQGAGALLQGPGGQDEATLGRLDRAVGDALPYAKAHGFWEDAATLSWTRCIARKRRGDLPGAAEALRALRDDIDARRLLIRDPRLRAGVPAQFRYLYEVSAEVLTSLGDGHAEELFHVIEGAKSKILGELAGATPLTSREASAGPDFFHWLDARTLADLRTLLALSRTRAAYLTLFSDESCTYEVLVRPDGSLATHRAPVGIRELAAAARRLHVLNDGDLDSLDRCARIDPLAPEERPYDEVMATYAPLVAWLEPELHAFQVLCISGDPGLLDVPMQMVPVGGRPLIDRVGVTAAPSARVLAHMARAASSTRRPSRATLVSVPRAGDSDQARDEAALYEALANTVGSLAELEVLADADAATVGQASLSGRLVHFATHGAFEHEAPLDRSGIFLARDGRRPEGKSSPEHLFTPKDLARLDLGDSRVVASACLCGRSQEVTPGEALGAVWALVQAGAATVMTAHWRVDGVSATAFFDAYYRAWLGESGLSPWQAHRRAIQRLRTTAGAYEHPYHWAPFVMYGPWD